MNETRAQKSLRRFRFLAEAEALLSAAVGDPTEPPVIGKAGLDAMIKNWKLTAYPWPQ
jgi:hypothetical protein